MVPGIQKILKKLGMSGGIGPADTDEFRLRRYLVNCVHDRVIKTGVSLRAEGVLDVRLIQHFPVVDLVVMAGLVPLTEFIRKAPICVPTRDASKIIGSLVEGGIAKFRALLIIPEDLIGVGRVGDGFGGLEHPLRNSAEVQHQGVTPGRIHDVFSHGVDQGEIPGGSVAAGRLQLGDAQSRVSLPRRVAHIVGIEMLD